MHALPIFCNHFEELQTVLFEVELVINNAPLTYVYPNTVETCLRPTHLFFDRELLYSSNTTSTVIRNLTVNSSTTDKINRISNHFWDKLRYEYVVNLRKTQRTSKLNINSTKINVIGFVLVYDEKAPRHFWRIAIVTGVLSSRDSEMARGIVRIANTSAILKHSVNKLFTFENACQTPTKQIRQGKKSLGKKPP